VTAWASTSPKRWRTIHIAPSRCSDNQECARLLALVEEWEHTADEAFVGRTARCESATDSDCYIISMRRGPNGKKRVFRSPMSAPELCQIQPSGDLSCKQQVLHPAQKILLKLATYQAGKSSEP
jgi:hypothetical protein